MLLDRIMDEEERTVLDGTDRVVIGICLALMGACALVMAGAIITNALS